ncbi:MAG: hypothetical protein ACREMA_16825, partial [Longimicrobiales bacterium]
MLLLATLSASSTAQEPSDAWLLTAGGDFDDEDGYRLDMGATWVPTDLTSVTVFASTADTSTDFNDFSSTAASLAVDHSLGRMGVSADVRWWG